MENLPRTARKIVAGLMALTALSNLSSCDQRTYDGEEIKVTAMGDSVGAGSGNLPYVPGTEKNCQQSISDTYANSFARALNIPIENITNVSCRGASPEDMFHGQYNLPPQLDALSDDTDIVTLSLGANSVDLNTVFAACRTEGCEPGSATWSRVLNRLTSDDYRSLLKLTYRTILQRAPNAHVYVVLYSKPIKPRDICPTIINLDADQLVSVYVDTLNHVIAETVREIGDSRLVLVNPVENVDACVTLGFGVIRDGENIGHPTGLIQREIGNRVARAALVRQPELFRLEPIS